MSRAIAVVLLYLLNVSASAAQQARVAVSPDTGTVGSIFRVIVRIEGAAAAGVVLPDTLNVVAPLENAARRREVADTAGADVTTVIYAVTAWEPGTHALPPLALSSRSVNGESASAIRLPSLHVQSVLPADTAGIEPRPAKAVVGPNWVLWPFIVLGILLLVALVLLGWWWYRRRRARQALLPDEPRISPRERALRELDAALAARGDPKEFYSRVSNALRGYVAALNPTWGVDLTTSELALRTRLAGADTARIERLLHDADLVKFARRQVTPLDADAFRAAARSEIETFDWPPPESPDTQEAA